MQGCSLFHTYAPVMSCTGFLVVSIQSAETTLGKLYPLEITVTKNFDCLNAASPQQEAEEVPPEAPRRKEDLEERGARK